ncbi:MULTISPECIES: hypothetical protein [unclassified Janthinobacterium]|uniref:hypothetical protein n=1 Tax=unclassified Janthinobacterium TaxID=2610881 RepID=UPI001621B012|nr:MULTISPECIES: hypothetical protein [unclassified Janthinobacterium]MBB5610420.1 hypothetical protein [Janthinobacterium sp. S3T4]MBB5615743.1 hypothetical protein [Janthinobacterium sp. S3M3]
MAICSLSVSLSIAWWVRPFLAAMVVLDRVVHFGDVAQDRIAAIVVLGVKVK